MPQIAPNIPALLVTLVVAGIVAWTAVVVQRKRVGRPTLFPLLVFAAWILLAMVAAFFTGLSGLIIGFASVMIATASPIKDAIDKQKRRFAAANASEANAAVGHDQVRVDS